MPLGFDEYEVLASICRESFYEFLKEFWDTIIPEKPIWNWHVELLCDEYQEMAERVFLGLPKEYDLVVNISPGTTKSTICSVAFPAWTWTRMPTARHICGSHTESLVLDLSRKCRDIVRSEKYRRCFPEIELRDDQDTKGQWMNTLGGERFSCTVGGKTPMGHHAHFIGIDDPIDPQKAVSDVELKTASDWMDSTLPSRKVDKMVTPTALVMQRLAEADPSGMMLERKGVRHICIPAELTEDVKPEYLRGKYVDGLMDPIRLPRKVLDEAYAIGEYHYGGQYLQSPVPRGGGMFKTGRLRYGSPPPLKEFLKLVRYWDKAGTAGGGAFTVGILIGLHKDGKVWILDVIRFQEDSGMREKIIMKTAEDDGHRVIIGIEQEPGSGGKESAENTVKMLRGWIVKVNKPSGSEGSKILRADPLSVQVNNGHVWLTTAEWNKVYVNEMKFFPRSRYKDQIDASSGGFSLLDKKGRQINIH